MNRKQPVVRNARIADGTVRVTVLGRGRPCPLPARDQRPRACMAARRRALRRGTSGVGVLAPRPAGPGRLGRAGGTLLRARRRGAPASCPRTGAGAGRPPAATRRRALPGRRHRARTRAGGTGHRRSAALESGHAGDPESIRPPAAAVVRGAAGRRQPPGAASRAARPFGAEAGVRSRFPRPFGAGGRLRAALGNPARARALLRILADWDPAALEARMPARPIAAHVVTGAHDPRIPVEAAQRLASRLDCGLTVSPDGGHVLTEQHPRLLARLLGEVAGRLPPPPDPRVSEV